MLTPNPTVVRQQGPRPAPVTLGRICTGQLSTGRDLFHGRARALHPHRELAAAIAHERRHGHHRQGAARPALALFLMLSQTRQRNGMTGRPTLPSSRRSSSNPCPGTTANHDGGTRTTRTYRRSWTCRRRLARAAYSATCLGVGRLGHGAVVESDMTSFRMGAGIGLRGVAGGGWARPSGRVPGQRRRSYPAVRQARTVAASRDRSGR
jgi:hypothetical protein